MALQYPHLIENSQFIYCSELDDPKHKLAGRTPLFKKTNLGLPYFDADYLMQHFNGYNKPYDIFNIKNERHQTSANYMRYVRNPPLSDWRKHFEKHHANIGEYFDWVHELPNNHEHWDIDTDRPSHYPPKPHTIFKEPSLKYIPAYLIGGCFLAAGIGLSCIIFGDI
jgi:hypothetical protein